MSNEQVILSSKTDSTASITEQGFTIQTQDGQQITRGIGETWRLLEWLYDSHLTMLYRLLMTSQLSDEDMVWPHEREDALMSEFNKDRAEKRLNVLYYLGRIGATSGTPEDEVESEMEDIAFSAAEQGLQFHWRMGNWTLRPMTPEEQTAFQEATKERAQ